MDTTGDCILNHKKGLLFVIFSLRFISFLLLVTTTSIGCAILSNTYPVMSLRPVLLTQDDLPTMRLTKIESERISGSEQKPSLLLKSEQRWSEGQLVVYYYLFHSTAAAQKATSPLFPAGAVPLLEPNPKEVIGDATWRVPGTPVTYIYFVKHNVRVDLMVSVRSSNRLQIARDVARKIEAKINAVLEKK